jgi:hypothetical protein
MQRLLLLLRSNWISATGAVLTTLAAMVFVTTFVYLALHGSSHGPYMGLFAFVTLPGLFVFGLVLIPLGWLVYRRELRQRMDLLTHKPFRLLRVIALLTLANIAVAGTGGYEAVHYMDSQQFCGVLCHQMAPTYATYLDAPHARVKCVECHIGSGADSYVKAKVSGLRQLLAMATGTFEKPIPTPVHGMTSPRDTCENCHWRERMGHERLIVRQHYADDEASNPITSVIVVKTGGGGARSTGVHWHMQADHQVQFVSTDRRTKVPWIRYTDTAGKERIFTVEGVDPKTPPAGELRTMDCLDCHNQPSHHQQLPDAAVDAAIAAGRISRRLPFVRKLGIEAIRQELTNDSVAAGIGQHLAKAYAAMPALGPEVQALVAPACEELAAIWRRNVQPDMRITWGTYPKFDTHLGCMRCHDGEHTDADGEAVTMECAKCHAVLAEKSADPDILKKLGLGLGNGSAGR